MSDANEPPRPEGPAGEPEPTPPSSEVPPPPPPGDTPPPPPASPYGGDPGQAGAYGGDPGQGGGYGAPPPAGQYGQPVPAGYSPTGAISFGWDRFKASPATLLIPMIVAWVGLIVIVLLVEFLLVVPLSDTHDCTKTINGITLQTQCGPSFFTRLLAGALASTIILLVFQFLAAGLYRGALRVHDGQDFGLGQLFEGWDKGQVAIAAILIAVATGIGTLLCYIPGLIVGFLAQFTLLFIVDKQMHAIDAIKASIKLVVDNLGNTILFYLLALVVVLVGACLCGVGLLVAYPVVLVAYAYTYRRLQGQPTGAV
jgi:uncharacterized membrane protein